MLLAGEWSTLQVGTHWMQPIVLTGQHRQQYRNLVPLHYHPIAPNAPPRRARPSCAKPAPR